MTNDEMQFKIRSLEYRIEQLEDNLHQLMGVLHTQSATIGANTESISLLADRTERLDALVKWAKPI